MRKMFLLNDFRQSQKQQQKNSIQSETWNPKESMNIHLAFALSCYSRKHRWRCWQQDCMINELRFQTINKWQMTNDKLTNGQSLFTNDKAVLKFHILLSNCAVILNDVVFPKIYFLVGNITTKMFQLSRRNNSSIDTVSAQRY